MGRPSARAQAVHAALSDAAVRATPWAIACGLLAGGLFLGCRAAWRAAIRRAEFHVDLSRVSLRECPPWVNADAMAVELRASLADMPRAASLFDRSLARRVRDRLSRCPWLLEVRRVERRLPNELVLAVVFRRPAGVAAVDGRRYLVDADGHWLREDLFLIPASWGKAPPPIVDRGLHSRPPVGRPWDEPRMAVGARLMELLRREGLLRRVALATVDVTGVGRGLEPDVVLTTSSGALIKWGRSSVYAGVAGAPVQPFGVPDAEKVAMLRQHLKEYPRLEGLRYVDLRFRGQVVFAEVEPVAGSVRR